MKKVLLVILLASVGGFAMAQDDFMQRNLSAWENFECNSDLPHSECAAAIFKLKYPSLSSAANMFSIFFRENDILQLDEWSFMNEEKTVIYTTIRFPNRKEYAFCVGLSNPVNGIFTIIKTPAEKAYENYNKAPNQKFDKFDWGK